MDSFFQFRKISSHSLAAERTGIIKCRRASDGCIRCFNGFTYSTLSVDPAAISDLNMSHYTGLAADHNVIAKLRAATDACLRSYHSVVSHFYVVGYLNEIIQLGPGFNNGRTH